MTRVDIDAKGGRAKKKPKAWSKSPPGKDEADHYDHIMMIMMIFIFFIILIILMSLMILVILVILMILTTLLILLMRPQDKRGALLGDIVINIRNPK